MIDDTPGAGPRVADRTTWHGMATQVASLERLRWEPWRATVATAKAGVARRSGCSPTGRSPEAPRRITEGFSYLSAGRVAPNLRRDLDRAVLS
ncbi:hypothetical protein MKK63_25930 [Methylobacterium sp. J-088]|uniref:hypothetical protein n=1 Tax=unclassified Methylobacterium TaxID=2615210 RepID=UPI001FBABE66|nr:MULTISPECIES: hypothetical protein [unclassified Methylobacterium]MCJ2066114.1 hypothetical protein [Methylobacterium sp. J-088]